MTKTPRDSAALVATGATPVASATNVTGARHTVWDWGSGASVADVVQADSWDS